MFEVLSTSGDTHLGGDDFDKRIVDWLASDFQKNEGIDLRKDRQVREGPCRRQRHQLACTCFGQQQCNADLQKTPSAGGPGNPLPATTNCLLDD